MNLFAGLEIFGIKADKSDSLFEDEKKKNAAASSSAAKTEEIPTEESFLLTKKQRCIVCNHEFEIRMVKGSKLRRLEPDFDLRPRHEYIDTLKYDVLSCPHCGYSAMTKYFEHISSGQIRMIKEQVCAKFKPTYADEPATIDYDTAINRYKLALFTAMAKRAKTSEKAYLCLKLSWLYRGKGETIDKKDPKAAELAKECKEQEMAFYQQAFEGFTKSVSTEMFPICGMDESTLNYLMATMAFKFKKYDVASKCIASIVASASASKKIKERALDLKEQVLAEYKKTKQA